MSNRRQFLKTVGGAGASLAFAHVPAAASMETVRTGLIGLGARGGFHLHQLLLLDGVEVKAFCDIHEPTMREHMDYCEAQGAPRPDGFARGEYDYLRMLEREDLDIVVIATPLR